ncbi:MAG: T9SS type A sorting domain-containing protein [Bacteroidetes bacterium]|nr:T9SS type A sorting domain-containing protein [Bacteroidota bacterium]
MKKLITLFLALTTAVFVGAQPGSIDLTYTTGTGFNSYVFKTAIQPDGKIIAVGAFSTFNGTARNGIARLNTDGTLDMSFNPGTGFNNWVTDVKIQPDGKIVTVGTYSSFNGTARSRIARLNADGTLDTSFDPGTGFSFDVRGCDLQADGKIIAVGDFTSFNGTSRNRIARINTNGSLDTGYDPGTGFNSNAMTVKIQPDGKALVGGIGFTSYNGTTVNRIVRLNSDATIDGSFNSGTGCNSTVATFAIQEDLKIIVGGSFTTYNGTSINRIMRLNNDGTIDPSFSVGAGTNGEIRNVQIASDGSVFLAGLFTIYNSTSANRIVKLTSDGSIDANFSTGTGFNNETNCISIQPDNKIIIGGFYTSYNGSSPIRIARLGNCVNTYATDYQTSCTDYTWIDGNTYSSNNTTATYIIPNATGCDSIITLNLFINAVSDETVSTLTPTFCDNGTGTISTSSSQTGVNYFLRNDSDDSVIDGPIAGTGSGLDFSTGSISTTTSYNVYGETIESSITFDGVDDEATVSGVDFSGTSFTIEFWAKRNALTGNDFFIGQGGMVTNQGLHIGFRPTNQFTFAFWSNDVNTPAYTDFDWHHWAVTYDAGSNQRKVYRDGILVASDIATNDYMGTGDLYFGDTPWGGSNSNGNMDELRVWSEVKEAGEIQNLMNNCITGDEANLLAYYTFDETAGATTFADQSSNGFDGSLVNMDPALAWDVAGIDCGCSLEMTDITTITVNYSTTGTDVQTQCDQYTWIDGNTYTASNNTATHVLTNSVGCDSVVTLDLTINYANASTDVQAHCDSYTWIDGNTYTTDNNTAQFTLTNMSGCDSLVTLNLTITTTPTAAAVNNGDGTLSATGSGTYQWIDCGTNAPVSGATSATFVPLVNGDYAVIVTGGSCDDTSACVTYNSVGIHENPVASIVVYPNPTSGLFNVRFGAEMNAVTVQITNSVGQLVYTENVAGVQSVDLNLEQANGIYFVQVYAESGLITTVKLVKQ